MATNLAIDERLLEEALKVGNTKSKKDTVNETLTEFIMRRKRKDILSLRESGDGPFLQLQERERLQIPSRLRDHFAMGSRGGRGSRVPCPPAGRQ